MSSDQERDPINALGQQMTMIIIDQLCAGIVQCTAQPIVNNTQPIYAANNDYEEAIDGVLVQHLTVAALQEFFETTLSLSPKHVYTLREEGITHPHDLTQLNSKEFDSVIRSVKGRAALPELTVVQLKQTCDF